MLASGADWPNSSIAGQLTVWVSVSTLRGAAVVQRNQVIARDMKIFARYVERLYTQQNSIPPNTPG
jgi:hypothetical protein